MSNQEIILGDCLNVMRMLEDNSIDGMCTDPPAGVSFMSKKWDSNRGGRDQWIDWLCERMKEAFRILKPGAQGLVWALPRTSYWTMTALEDAGFSVDNVVQHLFGSGMPMSKNIGRAIDMKRCTLDGRHYETSLPEVKQDGDHLCPWHLDGDPYRGVGTALKSAAEFWILVSKPIEGTYADNALTYGVGGLNIDACRVPRGGDGTSNHARGSESAKSKGIYGDSRAQETHKTAGQLLGGFPSHLILQHNDACVLVGTKTVAANGSIAAGTAAAASRRTDTATVYGADLSERGEWKPYGNGDGTETVEEYACVDGCPIAEMNRQAGHDVARYFYCIKPSRTERDAGLEDLPGVAGADVVGRVAGTAGVKNGRAGAGRSAKVVKNTHVTTKSITLMQYLVKMIARPGQTIIDPFAGSGTTLCSAALDGVNAIGMEIDEPYVTIARARLRYWQNKSAPTKFSTDDEIPPLPETIS